MIEQYNNQVLAFSKSFADAAFKAQGIALANFEKIADIQLKNFENRANATAAFVSEALEVRDFEGLKAIWPKGVTLAKESAEKAYATTQEVFGLSVKTGEALSEVAKTNFAATNETLQNQVNTFKKAATAAAK
ncbi:MAG TPA: phasin family protein [Tahibacter sp.]|nr:phasin family protein [Tahibacter sp.]